MGKSIYTSMGLPQVIKELERVPRMDNGRVSIDVLPEPLVDQLINIDVISYLNSNWVAPTGVIVTKEHTNTSIKITHDLAKSPDNWIVLDKRSTPYRALVPTSNSNIQVDPLGSYVIITNIDELETFSITLNFGKVAQSEVVYTPVTPEYNLDIQILSYQNSQWTSPPCTLITKEYSDTAIRITHNLGRAPRKWSVLAKQNNPHVGVVPTNTMNIQVDPLGNYVILTNMSSLEIFSVSLTL